MQVSWCLSFYRFIILNQGLNHPAKRCSMLAAACKQAVDIQHLYYVQDTHFSLQATSQCTHKAYPHMFPASAPEKKRWILLAVWNLLSFDLKKCITVSDAQFIILLCYINSKPFQLVNVYVPNIHQMQIIKKIFQKLHCLHLGNLVIGDEFNMLVNPTLDSTTKSKGHHLDLESLLCLEELYNVWRCQNRSKRDYVFFSPDTSLTYV